MVRSASSSSLQRKHLFVALGTLLGLASGAAHAQQDPEAISVPVTGRAPAVAISGIVNESVPASAPRVGHVLRIDASVTDADGDAITSTTYRWLRDDVEVANGAMYTPVAADAGLTLVAEVTANTDPDATDPAMGKAQVDVSIVDNAAPTADLMSIAGTIQVGEQITGMYRYSDPDNDLEGPSTFRWFRADNAEDAGTPIIGETGRNYRLKVADEGKWISFEVTPHSNTGDPRIGPPAVVRSAMTVAPANGQAPTATGVVVNGTPEVKSVLTGDYAFNDVDGDQEAGSTFKWYRADTVGGLRTEIPGATSQTYALQIADEGKFVFFEVTPRSATGEPKAGTAVLANTATAVAATNGTAPVISNVLITGRPTIGSTVTITYDYSDADGDQEGATGFVLCRKDVICGLTTTDTYVITEDDYYRTLNGHLEPRSLTGAPNQGANVPIPEFPAGGKYIYHERSPVGVVYPLPGTLEVGSVITATTNYVDLNDDPEGASIFQWYRATDSAGVNRVPIDGAVTNTYTVTEADIHKYLVLTYTPVAAEGRPDTLVGLQQERVSVIVSGHKPVATGLQITGTPALGAQVLGRYDYADDDGDQEGTPVYKWYRATDSSGLNKTLISGANSATYTVAPPDSDKYLVFEITPVSLTGHPKVGDPATIVASTAVPTIPNTPPVASDLSITGISRVGEVLTGHYSYSDVDEDVESGTTFQWYRSNNAEGSDRVAIPGATGKTYVMTAGDLDKFMVFEVTPRSATGSPGAPNFAVGSSGVMTYEVSGYHSLQPGVTASMEIIVAGRASSGKAGTPVTTLYVHAHEEALSFVLVAPDGTTFPLIRSTNGVHGTTLVDLSAYSSINGKWQVRVTQNGYPVGMGGQFNFFSITF